MKKNNPTIDKVSNSIFSNSETDCKYWIYDMFSKQIEHSNILLNEIQNQYDIDLTAYSKGIYTVVIKTSFASLTEKILNQ